MTVNVRRRQTERKRGTEKKRDKKVKVEDSTLSKYLERKKKKALRMAEKVWLPAAVKASEYIPIVGDLVNPPKLSPKGHQAEQIAKWKKKREKKKETAKAEKRRKNEANELKRLYGDWT